MGATVMPPSIPHVAATVMSRERSNPAVSGRLAGSVIVGAVIGVGVGVLTEQRWASWPDSGPRARSLLLPARKSDSLFWAAAVRVSVPAVVTYRWEVTMDSWPSRFISVYTLTAELARRQPVDECAPCAVSVDARATKRAQHPVLPGASGDPLTVGTHEQRRRRWRPGGPWRGSAVTGATADGARRRRDHVRPDSDRKLPHRAFVGLMPLRVSRRSVSLGTRWGWTFRGQSRQASTAALRDLFALNLQTTAAITTPLWSAASVSRSRSGRSRRSRMGSAVLVF
jgi:hypothetical protein